MTRAAIGVPRAAIAAVLAFAGLYAAAGASGAAIVAGRLPPPGAQPFATNIDDAAIARAIALGRSPDSTERQRFHDAYVIPLNDPLLDRLEIVTEFRRVVLATEDRVRAGDIDWGPRQAAAMLEQWRGKVTLVLRVTFPPDNTYRAMPPFALVLYGRPQTAAPPRIEPLYLLETPKYVADQPAPPGTPILGGIVEATFRAAPLNARAVYLAGIALEGRELRRVEVDFGRVE